MRKVVDIKEYFHGIESIKGIGAKQLTTSMWSPYEG
jgi:hypothetical protein